MKTKKPFSKLSKAIKSTEGVDLLINKLILRVKDNNPVTDNPMIDGMIIGWMLKYNRYLYNLIVGGTDLGRVLDSTIQKLEQISIWITNNEKKLVEIYEN